MGSITLDLKGQKKNGAATPVIAGMPREFWDKLLKNEPPALKPAPEAKVGRLPEREMGQILDNLRSHKALASETWGAVFAHLKKLDDEDMLAIMRAALGGEAGEGRGAECKKLISSLPKKRRRGMVPNMLKSGSACITARGAIIAASLPQKERSALFPLIEKAVGETVMWAGRREGFKREEARALVRLIAKYEGKERVRLLKRVFEARRFNGEMLEITPALRLIPSLPEKEQRRFFACAEREIVYEVSYGASWLHSLEKARGMLALLPPDARVRIVRACFKSSYDGVQSTAAKLLRDIEGEDRIALIDWFIRRACSPRRDWRKHPVYGSVAADVAGMAFGIPGFEEGRRSRLLEGQVRWLVGPWHTIAPAMRLIGNYPPEKRRELYDFAEKEVKRWLQRRRADWFDAESYLKAFPRGRRLSIALCALGSEDEGVAKVAVEAAARFPKRAREMLIEEAKKSAHMSVCAKAEELEGAELRQTRK